MLFCDDLLDLNFQRLNRSSVDILVIYICTCNNLALYVNEGLRVPSLFLQYLTSRNVDVNVVNNVGMLTIMDFGRIFGV